MVHAHALKSVRVLRYKPIWTMNRWAATWPLDKKSKMTQVPGTMHSLSIGIFVTVKQAWQIVHCFTEISGGSLVFHYNHVLTLFIFIAKTITAFWENFACQRLAKRCTWNPLPLVNVAWRGQTKRKEIHKGEKMPFVRESWEGWSSCVWWWLFTILTQPRSSYMGGIQNVESDFYSLCNDQVTNTVRIYNFGCNSAQHRWYKKAKVGLYFSAIPHTRAFLRSFIGPPHINIAN